MVKAGHRENDVLNVYSVEKVGRYLEDIIELRSLEKMDLASIVGTCVYCHTAADTKPQASKKNSLWKKFMDSLNPKAIKQKQKDVKNPMRTLAQLVPIFMPPPEEDKKESDD